MNPRSKALVKTGSFVAAHEMFFSVPFAGDELWPTLQPNEDQT